MAGWTDWEKRYFVLARRAERIGGELPSIEFLPPPTPPQFILVALSPSLATAFDPLALTSRSARPPSLKA